MTAACARVGANAPNGGDDGSLAGATPGGRVDEVTDVLFRRMRRPLSRLLPAAPRPRATIGMSPRTVARTAADLRSGLCPWFRPETLSTDAPVEAEGHRWSAGTVLVLGDNLGDDPLWRHRDAHFAKPRVIGDVAGCVPVPVEACVTCIDSPLIGHIRWGFKFPDIRGLAGVRFFAADGLAKLIDERGHILPDEILSDGLIAN